MNMAVSGAVGRGHAAHARPANFGQLNAAIARGDLTLAQNAFDALNASTAPAAVAAKARGSLEAIGAAIASGDVAAAQKSLADFRAGRASEPAPSNAPTPTPAEALPAPAPAPEPDATALPVQVSSTEQIIAMIAESAATAKTSI